MVATLWNVVAVKNSAILAAPVKYVTIGAYTVALNSGLKTHCK
jgi:hypothetical protein